jgi:hypothetical protein
MVGEPYEAIKGMRFWHTHVGDPAVGAVSEVLKYGREKTQLTHLEFMDCGIGPAGTAACQAVRCVRGCVRARVRAHGCMCGMVGLLSRTLRLHHVSCLAHTGWPLPSVDHPNHPLAARFAPVLPTAPGCRALGDALMLGANKSLVTLRLDNNLTLGDDGVVELSRGLRTNKTLKVRSCVAVGCGCRLEGEWF